MLVSLIALLVFQLIGELIARSLHLPLPGPVIGMLLLFCTLLVRGRVPADLQRTSQTLLNYLSLLFVPAGVGVTVHIALLRESWLPTLVTLVGSLVITMLATALTLHVLLRIGSRRNAAQGGEQ